MIEKEYKFVVNKIPLHCSSCLKIRQIYFDRRFTDKVLLKILKIPFWQLKKIDNVRLRIIMQDNNQNKYYLTAKTGEMQERTEYEKEISGKVARKLLSLKTIGEIKKKRYIVDYLGYRFEFDRYLNYKKLIVCEVEVNEENDDYKQITDILEKVFNLKYKDVTQNKEYKNSEIVRSVNYEND